MQVFEINKPKNIKGTVPAVSQQNKETCPVKNGGKEICLNIPDQFEQKIICPAETDATFKRPDIKKLENISDATSANSVCVQNGFSGNVTKAKKSIVVFARHIHTENHHNPVKKVTVKDIQKRYKELDFVGIEDHGRYFAFSKSIQKSVGPAVLPGAESYVRIDLFKPETQVNVKHHVGILGVDAREERFYKIKPGQKPSELKETIQKADGIIIFNHPEYPYIDKAGSSQKALDYTIAKKEAAAIDAVEVVNDVGFTGSEPLKVINWIERNFYQKGLFPSVVGGQDDHGPTEIARKPTYTMALTESNTEQALMDALRNSKSYISKSKETYLDLNIDNCNNLGEKFSLSNSSVHTLNIEIDKLPVNSRIEVVYNGQIIKNYQTDGDNLKESLKFQAVPGKDNKNGYLYLRSIGQDGNLNFLSSALHFSIT